MATGFYNACIDICGNSSVLFVDLLANDSYGDYIFINDKYEGIHVIDNSNPNQPVKVAFIQIPGNVDISVKDNFLYADSLMDLVILDISDLDNITIVNRLENVLQDYVAAPFEADLVDYGDYDYYSDEIIVGWEMVSERMSKKQYQSRFGDFGIAFAEVANDASGGTGQGGSLARFKIVEEYLYAVDSHNINIFNISDLDNPQVMDDVHAGFDIETIFNRDNYLFLGSMRGMYIYDISSPATPTFVSEKQSGIQKIINNHF